MPTRYLALLMLPAMLCFTGCAGKKEVPKAKPDPLAFTWALEENIRLETLVDECSKLDNALLQEGKALRQQWQQRYWPALATADEQFNKANAAEPFIYNGETLTLPAVKFMAKSRLAAQAGLRKTTRTPGHQRDFCSKRFAAYRDNSEGLGNPAQKNRLRYLQELAAAKPAALAPRALPSMAGTLEPLSAPGPSLYSIEQMVAGDRCSAPEIFTLRHQWPHEFYAVYCGDKSNRFISCEWSNCKAVEK